MIFYLTQRRAAKIDFLKLPLITLFFALSFAFPCTASGAVWYVHAHSDSGDGTNWANAFKTIQEAIIYAASTGDEIWLKEGTYNIYTQINVNKTIGIYGGFKGDETQREQRDWANNVTRIDGEGSVCHCLYVTADATIDGITITGGNADGSGSVAGSGGGIYNEDNSSPTISNCIFLVNSARSIGGAMYNSYYSSPTISNCIFLGNNSAGYGGAMYNDLWSSPTISNCTFSSNNAQWWGGGMSNSDTSLTINNCTFSDNSAGSYGGGIYNFSSSPTVTNSTFSGNYAGWGGGVDNHNKSSPTITNCTFSDNNANRGGGMRNLDSSPTITNCIFSDNSADYKGGGIENDENSLPIITNSILWNNTAPDGPQIYNDETSKPGITYSDIQGGYQGEGNINSNPLFFDLENNDFHLKGASPCIDTGNNYAAGIFTTDFEGETRIFDGNSDGVETVDMGVDEYYIDTDTDNDGLPDDWERRYFGDLSQGPNGDYDGDGLSNLEEYDLESSPARGPVSFYVNDATESSGDGTSWANAMKTIQEAIDAAYTGDEIWLKEGTYNIYSQINVNKIIGIYGGFKGNETQRNQRDWANNITTIDGQSLVYHCFYVTGNATIDGINITGGNANGSSFPDYTGGGIFNDDNSSSIITNCTFSGNSASPYGGGIYNGYDSSPTITNCKFLSNSAQVGGGMENYDNSSPTIIGCTFSGNSAKWGGGILNEDKSSPTIINCTFSDNNAIDSGGGIYNKDYSSPTITNCMFLRNSAEWGGGMHNGENSFTITGCTFSGNSAKWGGGMGNYESSPIISNCTFSGNSAEVSGGGIDNNESSPIVTNCVLWGDTAPDGMEINNFGNSNAIINYSDIQGGYKGTGNINKDPLFFDLQNNDFHLRRISPCIDAGYNYAAGISTIDFEDEPRIADGDGDGIATVDMGADEYTTLFTRDGDVAPLGSRDGKVNVGDALVALRFALDLEAPTSGDIAHGDVAPLDAENKPSPDGVINVGDALVILRKALGIISF